MRKMINRGISLGTKVFQSKKFFLVIALASAPVMLSFNNCSAGLFKSQGSLDSLSLSSLTAEDPEIAAGQKLYTTNCSACHGGIASSTKKGRSLAVITDAIQNISQMSALKALSANDVRLIGKALNPTLATTIENGRQIFACDMSQVPVSSSNKLTNREFKNSIFSLLNDFSTTLSTDAELISLINAIPADTIKTDRFAAQEQNSLLTSLSTKALFNAAFRAGALAASSNLAAYPNTAACLGAATVTQACHQMFVRELTSRAFRKPVGVTEGNIIAAGLWDATLSKNDLIQLTFTAVTQMPDFMYRTYDQGGPSNRGPRILTMNTFELASKVSFFLTGKAPDDTLKSLAASGTLLTKTTLAAQVDRLLTTPDAQENIRRLFKESYGYDRFDNFNYSANFLSGLDSTNLTSAMTQELDNYFVDTLINKPGTFKDLMTSQNSNIPTAQLAAVYGLSSAGTTMLPVERAGFLNRAAFLAKKSGNYTSPVKRGLMVLENVLCEAIGDPPPNAPTSVPETAAGQNTYQSTRERYAHLSENPGTSCLLCHSRINSLGYTFEKFDSIGRSRSVERIFDTATGPSVANVNLDTMATIPDLRSSPVTISGSTQLASALGNNDKAMMCFVKHLRKFQSRSTISGADGCQMNTGLRVLYGNGIAQGSVKEALKQIILSDDFKLWSY